MVYEEVLAGRSHQETIALFGIKPLHPALLPVRLSGGHGSRGGLDGEGGLWFRAVAGLVLHGDLRWTLRGVFDGLQDYRILGHLDHDRLDAGPVFFQIGSSATAGSNHIP